MINETFIIGSKTADSSIIRHSGEHKQLISTSFFASENRELRKLSDLGSYSSFIDGCFHRK